MTENANQKSTAALTGAAVIFGMMASEILSDVLIDQSYWLRIAARAIAAGVLAAVFVLVANRLMRR